MLETRLGVIHLDLCNVAWFFVRGAPTQNTKLILPCGRGEGTKTSFMSVYVAHGNKRLTLWFDAKVIRLA